MNAGPMKADARQLMIDGLKNAHGLETQAVEMLERNTERLEHYPDLKARIARHLEESRSQRDRLGQALTDLGEKPSTVKDTVMGLAQNLQAMAHSVAGDEVLKNAYTGYAFEHFEIATYKALAEMAKAAGEPRVESLAKDILKEEEEMAHWLESHLPGVVHRYIELMPKGQAKH